MQEELDRLCQETAAKVSGGRGGGEGERVGGGRGGGDGGKSKRVVVSCHGFGGY